MSDEIVTWTEAEKAELLDAIVKAACTCNEGGLCVSCDAMIYGGDQVDAIVGTRDRDIKQWHARAQAAERLLAEERAQARMAALGYPRGKHAR